MAGKARFVGTGKRARRERTRKLALEEFLDGAIGAVQFATEGLPRLCLQTCVLLLRLLDRRTPNHGYSLKLGALKVVSTNPHLEGVAFDPRGPEGIDGGFHAWLEHDDGELLDPTILLSLAHDGYPVQADGYVLVPGRRFEKWELRFVYEPLPELELIGEEESEPQIAVLLNRALTGAPLTFGHVYLDIRFRGK